jgi:hypothetical protein
MYADYHNTGPNRNLRVRMAHNGSTGWMRVELYCDFQFRNHDSADDSARAVAEWSDREKGNFRREFVRVCRETWSRQWLLVGHREGSALRVFGLGQEPATVRLDVDIMPVDNSEHTPPEGCEEARVVVYRRNPQVRAGRPNVPHGENAVAIYASSTEESSDRSGLHRQIVAAHEFGHLLGFLHVSCPSHSMDQSDDMCYGTPGSSEANDIMGRGMIVSRERYQALCRPIIAHADDSFDWSVASLSVSHGAATEARLRRPPGLGRPMRPQGPQGVRV